MVFGKLGVDVLFNYYLTNLTITKYLDLEAATIVLGFFYILVIHARKIMSSSHLINRNVLLVKAREPFIQWEKELFSLNNEVYTEPEEEEVGGFSRAYLIPYLPPDESEEREAIEKIIEQYHEKISSDHVSSYGLKNIPPLPQISVEVFKQWFSYDWFYDLQDLIPGPLSTREINV
ncbi:MAG: hypothetical protein AB2827_12665 [Candidatus Thiodiazotropha sp.]